MKILGAEVSGKGVFSILKELMSGVGVQSDEVD